MTPQPKSPASAFICRTHPTCLTERILLIYTDSDLLKSSFNLILSSFQKSFNYALNCGKRLRSFKRQFIAIFGEDYAVRGAENSRCYPVLVIFLYLFGKFTAFKAGYKCLLIQFKFNGDIYKF